jgi:hypothetical protein
MFGVALVWFLLPAEHSSELPIRIATAVALLNVVGIGYSIRAATHRALDRRARRAWRLMILCFMLLAGCGAAFGSASDEDMDQMPVGIVVAVVLRVLLVVLLLTALLSFTAEPVSRRGRLKIALDATTVLGGGAMTLWYLLIGAARSAPDRA